jgi:sugar phosphate permease
MSGRGAEHVFNEDDATSTRFRFVIVGLLFTIATVNYVDRGALSFASEQIIKTFGFDSADWGSILGFFGYGYMFGALCGGTMLDRWGARKMWIVAGVAWSIFESGTALAGEFGLTILGGSALAGFAVMRSVFGFTEGPAFSSINKTIARWAAPRERALLSSFALASTPFGAMLAAPITVGLLTLTGDWRMTFVALGVGSLALIAIFAWVFTDSPEQSRRVNARELAKISAPSLVEIQVNLNNIHDARPGWLSFFSNRTLVLNAIGYFSFLYVTFLLLTWAPKYLQNHFHYSLSSLSYVGVVPWVGSCVAVLVGGKLSDLILAKTGNLRIARGQFAAACLLLAGICFLLVPMASSAVGVLALMTLANALNTLPNAVYWVIILDTAPRTRIGAFSGITHFIANISSIAAPTLTGYLVKAYGYDAMFFAVGIVSFVGMVAMLCVEPGAFLHRKAAMLQSEVRRADAIDNGNGAS